MGLKIGANDINAEKVVALNRAIQEGIEDGPRHIADVLRFVHPRLIPPNKIQLDFTRGNNVTNVEYHDAMGYLAESAAFASAILGCNEWYIDAFENVSLISWEE